MILTGISLNQIPMDWEGNFLRIVESLQFYETTEVYKQNDSHIILFPELVLSGYGCEDGFLFSSTKKYSWKKFKEIIKFSNHLKKAVIFVGFPFYYQGNLYNSIGVLHNGNLKAIIPKSYLAGEGIHYEPRWFTPYQNEWKNIQYEDIYGDFFEFLFGQGVIEYQNVRIGIEICEDAWVNNRPSILHHFSQNLDLILNPAASHAGFGKYNIRKNIAKSTSQYFQTYYFTVNLLGNEAGKAIYDGSSILARNGRILNESKRFSFYDILIESFPIELKELQNKRDRIYSRRIDRDFEPGKIILKISTEKSVKKPIFGIDEKNTDAIFQNSIFYQFKNFEQKEEKPENIFLEFLETTRLGLFDYMRKTHNKGYTISLSGGADSSLCAILVYEMIVKGVNELGVNNFLKKIGYLFKNQEEINNINQDNEEIIRSISKKILHTIYQRTNQNKEITQQLAEELAQEINSDHITVDIQSLVDTSINLIEDKIQKKLTWDEFDIPLQNIQARIRSPIAWLYANITNSILIATSNRSEASVGYTTMDGDSSGGIAPIAGIEKSFIMKFLQFISHYSDEFTQKITTAKKIVEQKPSAELKPIESEQTDEKDLMPYPILAMIERFAIEELLSAKEILNKIENLKKNPNQFVYHLPYYEDFIALIKNYNETEIKQMITKFFDLWNKNQWKRERFATSFHIDSYNLDPRGWFRYPVISKNIPFFEE